MKFLVKFVPNTCRGGFTNQFSHPQITLINPPLHTRDSGLGRVFIICRCLSKMLANPPLQARVWMRCFLIIDIQNLITRLDGRGGFTNQFSHPQITLINPPLHTRDSGLGRVFIICRCLSKMLANPPLQARVWMRCFLIIDIQNLITRLDGRGGFTNQFSHPQITLINPPPPHPSLGAGFYHLSVVVKDVGEPAPTI